MPLTPADVHNVSFTKPGRGGYVEEEVDAFLDEVERELARLMAENSALKGRVRGGAAPDDDYEADVDYDEIRELAARLRMLEQARDRAEQHARELAAQVEQARRAEIAPADDGRHLRVLAMAQRTADEHLNDARRESDEIIATARDKAEQLAAEARARAADIEGDARRRHAEAMDGIAGRRAALIDEVEQLSGLATHYRQALSRHVDHQLEGTEGTPRLG
ncbi:DivIVA domain-containing protein [Actinoplanes sichuanensis]|uniref:Cell wall synthesis protein Wag31 n=1 Tax=Actinoplanes sichuanensis TaxID=512349 RepID=A0ABW4ANN9_9ACTN|nr:DivIVA domain-containing protein [Actinoplanes sichuanensis]BEL06858.1 DivIVA domain-containing protein [Actinoplanes sichuanensis]